LSAERTKVACQALAHAHLGAACEFQRVNAAVGFADHRVRHAADTA
jgi:hypothetical protein